jgi:uncharacterized protein (TIGR03032 family)
METVNIPPPIFVLAPPAAAEIFEQTLGRSEDVFPSDGRLDALIAAHGLDRPQLTAADATTEIIAAIRGEIAKVAEGKRLLDTSMRNSFRTTFLLAVFPEAAFVWIFREPLRAVYDPRDTNPLPPEERAREWNKAMAILADDLERLPARVWMSVPYRMITQYPDQAMTGIAAFLGVQWDGRLPPHRDEVVLERAQMPDSEKVEEITSPLAKRVRELFVKGQSQARPRAREQAGNDEVPPAAFASMATDNFGQLLRELGVSLIVSTYQSGCVILIRAETSGAVTTYFRSYRSPMGIAVRKGEIVLGTKTELWKFHNAPAIARQIKHDACFLPRQIHVTGDIRVHEIAFASDELWLINTRFSSLCTLDAQSSFVPRWRPPFVSRLAAEDRCHLNGMAIIDDRVQYVTALGATDTQGGWRDGRASGGVLVDVGSGETVLRELSMPHSPRQYDGRFFLLESGKGTIATADLASGHLETVAELPGFTRGLAFAGPYAFIGLSQVRESNIFGGIPLTERVDERQCGIYIVDLRTGETVAFLRFEGSVHEIFDVQVLHGIRYPQLVDLTDQLVSSAFAVPDEALSEFE